MVVFVVSRLEKEKEMRQLVIVDLWEVVRE